MTDSLLTQYADRQRIFLDTHQEIIQELASKGQAPEVLFIGCADSRVTPEQLFRLAPGEWFMMRNVANIVPPYWQTELSTAAVLEFSVMVLQVKHIVVCGHTDCGGMSALINPPALKDFPGMVRWLDTARQLKSNLPLQQDKATIMQQLIERNVVLQLEHLRSYPYVRNAEQTGRITLHGWVYDMEKPTVTYYSPETDKFQEL